MSGLDSPWHWIVLAIIVILLFGYKKLPDAARSLGRSLRIFKTEIKGMGQDDQVRRQAADHDATTEGATVEQPPRAIQPPRAQTVPNPAARPRPMPSREPRA